MSEFVFEARNLSKNYGVIRALNNVSIGIRRGEVHAIIGENGAGKSTLMSLFCGKVRPDAGTLWRNDENVSFHAPAEAQAAGITIAPQEINLVPGLSVAENIMLGMQPKRASGFGIDWAATRLQASQHLHAVDDGIDPDMTVSALSKAHQQLVQIARAAATSAEILILDEPTATLTWRETEKLFAYVKAFRRKGGSVFYISHRLDEILELSDRISALRDGSFAGELNPASATKDDMVRLMAGRATTRSVPYPSRPAFDTPPVLEVRNLSRSGEFSEVSFTLHQGEILGVSGLIGSGRTELARCIFGLTRPDAGQIRVFGEDTHRTDPLSMIRRGLVYLPEERKQEGIFPLLSIAENMAMPSIGRFRNLATMRSRDMMAEVDAFVARLRIKIGSARDPITSLSGGNQQKVIIGRWLMKNARILIMDEPTRGIDVNAKSEIQAELRRFTEREGLSIIFISSELEEVMAVSDRILVMHEGRVKATPRADEVSQETLLQMAMS